jgi:hypothetical protein
MGAWKRRGAALIVSAIAIVATGCHELEAGTDIARQPDGLGQGGYSGVIRDLDPPGQNTFKGREDIWADIDNLCNAAGSPNLGPGGAPGAGYPGYGGFSPPTSGCVTAMIGAIQDDPADPNDEASWVCQSGRSCHAAYGTVSAGTGTADMAFTTWYRAFFTNTTQGRHNMERLIEDARDFYVLTITDPNLPPNQATGPAGCIAITDAGQAGLGGEHIALRRQCF